MKEKPGLFDETGLLYEESYEDILSRLLRLGYTEAEAEQMIQRWEGVATETNNDPFWLDFVEKRIEDMLNQKKKR